MAQLQALLQIKADVQGENKVESLGRALGGLDNTASRVSGSLRGLVGAAGGLRGVLGGLGGAISGIGLGAIAKGAINAADNMNDVRQKTGVSVEQLSKFQQAAEKSGTSLEGVSSAMVKLNRNLATDNKAASKALDDLGISATDASGNLKSTDQVMLEVADAFAKMPDGAEKSAAAMALFGKSGADLIPLLNGGRESIESLRATMTGEFAAGADALNDKIATIQTRFAEVGIKIGTAVMPAFSALADVIIGVADAFSNLPGPIQAIVVGVGALAAAFLVLAPAISAIVSIAGVLAGLKIGATIAGWAGAIGPAVSGITAALSGLLAWLTGTMLPGLLAFFSGPVGWTVLAVAAVVAMAIKFREPIGKFFSWLGEAIGNIVKSIGEWLQPIGEWWGDVWSNALNLAGEFFSDLGGKVQDGLEAALGLAYNIFVKPWVDLWNNVLREPISDLLSWMGGAIKAPFEAAAKFVKDIINGILQIIAGGINGAIKAINTLIIAYNKLPTPDIPTVPTVSIPQFAEGGVVNRPTLAMVGEGGEREYIIPESKMAAASARYLSGSRGGSVLRPGPSSINITTGPIMQQGGQQWVTMADLIDAMRATEDSTLDRLRTFAGRRSAGII
jgi:hypothetical protein